MSSVEKLTPISPIVPADPVVEEIRFAVVMYGGIALCVYMSGITDVLLNMVVSTAREEGSRKFLLDHDKLSDVQRILRKAAQLHTAYRKKEIADLPEHEGVAADCKFVIDILSGTSAGGLNNIFLAKALANEQNLDKLANLWVQEGDISKLMNDDERSKDKDHVKAEDPPQSLLNSVRMQQRLLDAFVDMEPLKHVGKAKQSRLVDHLDLYITSTDLKGLELKIKANTGTEAVERKNRAVFHLAYDPLGVPTVQGSDFEYRNDFSRVHTPFLSFIGRATSCIVPAFEPIQLNDLARLSYYQKDDLRYDPKKNGDRFAYFFPDYKSNEFQARFFGDGGYGDNFPFGHAIDAVKKRSSNVSVDRILLYVEPDPEVFEEKPNTKRDGEEPRPTFLEHISAAGSVKSTEKIREDVERIQEHSELLERIRHGIDEVKFAKLAGSAEDNETYTNLRDLVAVDDITDFLWDLVKHNDRPDVERRQVRWFIRGLKANLGDEFAKNYDFATLQRQIGHACREIDGKLLRKTVKESDITRPMTDAEMEALVSLRNKFSSICLVIDRIPRLIRLAMPNRLPKSSYGEAKTMVFKQANEWAANPQTSLEGLVDDLVQNLTPVLRTCDLTEFAKQIRAILFGSKFDVSKQFAATVTARPEYAGIQLASLNLLNELKRQVAELSSEYNKLTKTSFPLANDFFKFDQRTLPLIYGVEAVESGWVSLCRVSPLDSKTLFPGEKEAKAKLAGAGLGHFGGFFKDMWRVHDILWGQLDAIENLICKVVRQDCFARRELIFAGQLAVIKNFKRDFEIENVKEIPKESRIDALCASLLKKAVDQFYKEIADKGYDPHGYDLHASSRADSIRFSLQRLGLTEWAPADLELLTKSQNPVYKKAVVTNNDQIQLTGRSLNVLDGMLETVGERGRFNKILSIGGRILVTVAKILTPGSLQGSIFRHWLGLAIFFDATLLACGIFWNEITPFAVKASIATASAAAVIYCLDIAVNTKKGFKGGLYMLGAFVLAALGLWLIASGKIAEWITAMTDQKEGTWFERMKAFFQTDFGIQWALLSGLTIVVYLTWLRLQKAHKVKPQGDKVLAAVSTLVLVAIGLGIPGAIIAKDTIPDWVWYIGAGFPALLVLLTIFGLWARGKSSASRSSY